MSELKATPGPWHLVTHHRQGHDRMVPVWYIQAENKVGIAVQPSYSCPNHEAANARLIAAAPAMFEALAMIEAGHSCPSAVARNALSLALGEKQDG